MKSIFQSLKTIVLALIIGLAVAYAVAWTGPTEAPPGANVPGPINKGSAEQIISNDITLKGASGTEGLNLQGMRMFINGMFETTGDTHLATGPNAKVGIGTANPTVALDVNGGIRANGSFLLGRNALAEVSRACMIVPLANNPYVEAENIATGYYKIEDGVSYTKARADLLAGTPNYRYCDSGWIPGDKASCSFAGVYPSTGQPYTYKTDVAFVSGENRLDVSGYYNDTDDSTTCANSIAVDADPVIEAGSGGLAVSGGFDLSGDLRLGGSNSWILHTPDDGRTDLFIAPKKNGLWDWANQLKIDSEGNVSVNGLVYSNGLSMSGGIDMNGYNLNQADTVSAWDLQANERLHISPTSQSSWPVCSQSFAGDIRFSGKKLYGCEYYKVLDDSGDFVWGWRALGD